MDTPGAGVHPEEGAEALGGSVESGMHDANPAGAAPAPAPVPSSGAEVPATAQAAADSSAASQPETTSGHGILSNSETPVCETAARAPARDDASAGHQAAPADARAVTTSAASPCDMTAAVPHSSAGDGAGAGEDGRTDATLGKRTRRPTSKAIAGEASSVAPAAPSSAPPAAVAAAEESMVVTVDPAADSVLLLSGSQNRVWLNKKWHRRTADGKLAVVEKKSRGASQENRSSSAQSRGAKQVRRSARESRESLSARRNDGRSQTRGLSKSSKHENNKGWRHAAKRDARHAAATERHVPGPVRTWKMSNAGSYAGDAELLHQVARQVYLYDKYRHVSIRLDDSGLYYSRGLCYSRGHASRRHGNFEEHGTWCNADKSKMLVAEYGADGKTKRWRERQEHQTFASFKEIRCLVYLGGVGKEGGARYWSLDDEEALVCHTASPWHSSSEPAHVLHLLEGFKWEKGIRGAWSHQGQGAHVLSWRAADAAGTAARFAFTSLPVDESQPRPLKRRKATEGALQEIEVNRNGRDSLRCTADLRKARGEGRSHHKLVGVSDARKNARDRVRIAGGRQHERGGGECACGEQLPGYEVLPCPTCGRSAHAQCLKGAVPGARAHCARCSKPKLSSKKRGLDDRARNVGRNVAPVRNAEEARAAKKRLKLEKDTETRVLAKKLADEGLCTVEIPADGHCLFSALSDQLKRTGCSEPHSYKTLRRAAACYMLNNEQHFKGFLALESNSFEQYCKRIEKTNAWGGQHELIALSHHLKRNIQVLRHDMSIQMFPDPSTHPPYEGEPLRISYHIHEYNGGEHYNSVISLEEKNKRARAHRAGRAEEDTPAAAQAAAGGSDACASASASSSAAHKEPKPPRAPLTEEQRLKKMGKKGAGKKKIVFKPLVPWQRGVGGDDARVLVWDTRDGRLINGNACPTAKNIDQYLEKKPWMRVWSGGSAEGEPQAPKRADEDAKRADKDAASSLLEALSTSAPPASTADTNTSEDARAQQDGSAPDGVAGADARGAQDEDHAPASAHAVGDAAPLPSASRQQRDAAAAAAADDDESVSSAADAQAREQEGQEGEASMGDHCGQAGAQLLPNSGAPEAEHIVLSQTAEQREEQRAAEPADTCEPEEVTVHAPDKGSAAGEAGQAMQLPTHTNHPDQEDMVAAGHA